MQRIVLVMERILEDVRISLFAIILKHRSIHRFARLKSTALSLIVAQVRKNAQQIQPYVLSIHVVQHLFVCPYH